MIDDLEIRKQKATAEWREVLKWAVAEEEKVSEQLDKEGAIRGLDTNQERFAYIKETVNARIKDIIHKYDLPNKAQWA